jgi:hypothetical protein
MMSRNISTRLSAVVRFYSSILSRTRQQILDRPPQGMMGVWYDSVRNRQHEKTGAIWTAGSSPRLFRVLHIGLMDWPIAARRPAIVVERRGDQ